MTDWRRIWVIALLAAVIGMPDIALAVPKGPGGQTCKSSGTTTVNGKEEGTGKAMTCTADYCKYDECETSGPNIGKCYEKTSYSNVRDCKAAAMKAPQSGIVPGQMAPLTQQGQTTPPPPQRMPQVQGGGIMKRDVETEKSPEPPTTSPEPSGGAQTK